jgi:osmotically-inducible protein OsmY
VVYLIGIAQSKKEIDKVIAHARSLSYVKRVISHVRIKKAAS